MSGDAPDGMLVGAAIAKAYVAIWTLPIPPMACTGWFSLREAYVRAYNPAMLAAAPITWGVCELPGWGEVPPYQEVLDQMAAAGFRGTELGPEGYLPQDPETLKSELGGRDLALVGAFHSATFHIAERVEESLAAGETLARLLSDLDCRMLIAADAGDEFRRGIAGRVTAADALRGDSWRRMGEGLSALARRCAPYGVRVCFHPHAGTCVETEAELDALLACTPAEDVGLCLDTGHIAYGGGDPLAVCQRHLERIWHVHTKDVRGDVLARVRREGIPYAEAIGLGAFVPLGQGMIDFRGVVSTLRGAGYQGWWVLEQDVRLGPQWPAQDPAANARQSAAYLHQLMR